MRFERGDPPHEWTPLFLSQTVLNELMHKVAHDREFLTATLAQTIKVDDFTGRLFKIYETVWDEGLAQVRIVARRICSSSTMVVTTHWSVTS